MTGFIGEILNFLQPYADQPPAQSQASFDLASFLVTLMSILGTIITLAGVIISIYFFYWTMKTSVKFQKTEQSVDPNINILNIKRYPIEQSEWEGYKKTNDRRENLCLGGVIFTFLILLLLFIAFIVSLFRLYILHQDISSVEEIPTFLPLKNISNEAVLIGLIAEFILYIIFFLITIAAYKRFSKRGHKLNTDPEKGSRWVMEKAKISVFADYNYLLLKARWSLKQMKFSAINVKSKSVEGIVGIDDDFTSIKASIKPDQDDEGAFVIKIKSGHFPDNLTDQLLKGEYINHFLDLMGSGGFDVKNHD